MGRKLFSSYEGSISAESAAKGIQAALQTARSLISDALLLSEHGRWPRAMALALLAIEEVGKTHIIRMSALKACVTEGQETGILDEGDNDKEIIKLMLEGYN